MEQDLQQILARLEENTRKQTRWAKWQCIFSLAAAVFCGVLLIAVLRFLPQMDQAMTQVHTLAQQAGTVLENLETVTEALAEADLAGMVENIDALAVTSQEGVSQAMEKINAMDIAALNKAITDLANVVEPLAKLVNVFK